MGSLRIAITFAANYITFSMMLMLQVMMELMLIVMSFVLRINKARLTTGTARWVVSEMPTLRNVSFKSRLSLGNAFGRSAPLLEQSLLNARSARLSMILRWGVTAYGFASRAVKREPIR